MGHGCPVLRDVVVRRPLWFRCGSVVVPLWFRYVSTVYYSTYRSTMFPLCVIIYNAFPESLVAPRLVK